MKTSNMEFDGIGAGPKKGSTKFAHNNWSGHSNDGRLVNKGRGPTRGNDGTCDTPKNLGASVTRDAYRRPDTSAVPSLPAQGSVRDSINRGHQDRGVGGTQVRKPNPDSIRIGQGGGTAYGSLSRGSRPVAPGSTEGINYGPKKQY
jgi:hypothetical protein